MKKTTHYLVLLFSLGFITLLPSCKKNEIAPTTLIQSPASRETQNRNAKEFAQALSKLIVKKEVRDFLKKEALEKFGGDYDIFYPAIKNKLLDDGLSFKSHIENAIKQNSLPFSLSEIEQHLPLLNILVPELNNFSAKDWNTAVDIPMVAVRNLEDVKANKKMIAYSQNGSIQELDYHTDPNTSLIIIKDNESVEIRNNQYGYNTLNHDWVSNHPVILVTDGVAYYFSDESMYNKPAENQTDGIGGRINTASRNPMGGCSRSYYFSAFDILAQQAYNKNIYNPTCPDNLATTRDFIYYGIDPTIGVNQGPLKYNYREYITSIRCEDLSARSRFDDLGEGNILDFDITVYTADNDPIFPLKKRLSIDKTEFFRTNSANITPIPVELLAYPRAPLEIAVWNFKRQGDIWKYAIYEYDPSTITTESRSITANIGTNFSIGDEKVGGKFGLTSSIAVTNTVTISYTNVSDDLGEAVSYWCDPVIKEKYTIPQGTTYICGWANSRPLRSNTETGRSYDIGTGVIAITVEPRAKN